MYGRQIQVPSLSAYILCVKSCMYGSPTWTWATLPYIREQIHSPRWLSEVCLQVTSDSDNNNSVDEVQCNKRINEQEWNDTKGRCKSWVNCKGYNDVTTSLCQLLWLENTLAMIWLTGFHYGKWLRLSIQWTWHGSQGELCCSIYYECPF